MAVALPRRVVSALLVDRRGLYAGFYIVQSQTTSLFPQSKSPADEHKHSAYTSENDCVWQQPSPFHRVVIVRCWPCGRINVGKVARHDCQEKG